jgi:hypothetical protein
MWVDDVVSDLEVRDTRLDVEVGYCRLVCNLLS